MWEMIVALTIWGSPALTPDLPQRPYLSCIDGHIVQNLGDCPPIPKHVDDHQIPLGGGGRRGGLLGLGGLGGIL